MQFFWDKSNKSNKARSRFNLLLLEYGEFYFEDYSAALYPIPTSNGDQISTRNLIQIDSLKWVGRLKVCSRCLIFEPTDTKKPLLKFPFRYITTTVSEFSMNGNVIKESSIDTSGFLTFTCTSYFEIKPGNKIGPYRQVEPNPAPAAAGASVNTSSILSAAEIKFDPTTKSYTVLFSLIHSSISTVLAKINQLKQVFDGGERVNKGDALLKPLIEEASMTTFDSSRLVNFHERLLLPKPVIANKIKPLVMYPGCLMITESRVYFQSAQLNNVGEHVDNTIFDLSKITRVYKRRYLLQQIGIELFLNDQTSTLLVFESRAKRDEIHALIARCRQSYPQNPPLESITKKWQRREITNFEYLMYLNSEADRSVNDLTQYPVFPHIIADYLSKTLDLANPSTFRDLSKPIGALTSHRLESFKERFYNMSPADEAFGVPPPFLYGTHYSTPGYVLFYLVRVAPEHMLCLQNGRFDVTDRMFSSVKDMWQSCLMNPADLKELIPEFFCGHGDFLINSEGLNMGHKHTGERLEDVELPPWAKTPQDFIRKNMKALESDYVSANLHNWIDLIFGYKQTGEEAIKADNLFYHLTYEGSVDVEKMTDSVKRKAIEVQIQEFGQTPKQLFDGPHPARSQLNEHVPVKNDIQLYTSAVPAFDGIVKDVDPSVLAARSGKSAVTTPRRGDNTPLATPSPNPNAAMNPPTGLHEDTPNSVADAKVVVLDAEFKAEVERELRNSGQLSARGFVEPPSGGESSNGKISNKSILGAAAATRAGAGAWALWNSITTTTNNIFRPANGSPPQSTTNLAATSTSSNAATTPATPTVESTSASSTTLDTAKSSQSAASNEALKVATAWGADSLQSSQQGSPVKPSAPSYLSSPLFADTFSAVDASKVSLIVSEPIRLHSSAITSISAQLDKSPLSPAGETNKSLSFLLAASAKDSSVKVLNLQLDSTVFSSSGSSSGSVGTDAVLDPGAVRGNVKRTFLTGAEPPLSSCILTKDASTVFTGCWDNSIYSYSVASASELGRREAHTDSVSALSTDNNNRWLLSGSWDTTVKLWEIKSAVGVLSAQPQAEFFDHDRSVVCVALEPLEGRFAAAGAEDGTVIIWNTEQVAVAATVEVSRGSVVTNVVWVPLASAPSAGAKKGAGPVGGYKDEKLICTTNDGNIVCVDSAGRLFAAIRADSYVRCLTVSLSSAPSSSTVSGQSNRGPQHALLIGGCEDGTVRVWQLLRSKIEEVHRVKAPRACTSITCLNPYTVATGADDGTVRVWKLSTQ